MLTIGTDNVALSSLESYIKQEQKHMTRALRAIVNDCKRSMAADRSLYMDSEHEEPSIDVRLCVDRYETNSNPFSLVSPLETRFEWTFRTGDVSYDQRHSRYCAASSITLDSTVESLLVDLIDQIFELEAVEEM